MSTATSTTAPWGPQQPYLTYGFNRARNLYDTGGPQYYPGSTVAPLSTQTRAGIDQYTQTAQQGTPVAQSAQDQVNATLQGDYLNSNPYLDAMYNNAASAVTRNYSEAVAPSIAANFGLSGRSGSNMAFANAMDTSRDTLSRNLGGMAANIYGGNYANERQNQMQAAGMAPQTAGLNYFDANQLLQAGALRDDYLQRVRNDRVNRWNFDQERPYDALGRYQQMIQGTYGGTSTQPVYGNSTLQNIGMGMGILGGAQELGVFDFLRGMFP